MQCRLNAGCIRTCVDHALFKIIYLHAVTKFEGHMSSQSHDVNFGYITYIHPDIQNVMHKSPSCIRTGGLKNDRSWAELIYNNTMVLIGY